MYCYPACPDISPECKEEWPCLKQLRALNYSSLTLQQFRALVCKNHQEQFPHLIKCLYGCPYLYSHLREGCFSTQNRIKTKLRNRLKVKCLDILMRISEGPAVEKLDYSRPAKIWCEKKEHRLFMTKRN